MGFPAGLVVKKPPANAGDAGLICGLGRSPGGGNGIPIHHSCLENPRSLVGYRPWGCKESDTTERLSMLTRIISTYDINTTTQLTVGKKSSKGRKDPRYPGPQIPLDSAQDKCASGQSTGLAHNAIHSLAQLILQEEQRSSIEEKCSFGANRITKGGHVNYYNLWDSRITVKLVIFFIASPFLSKANSFAE